MYLNTTGGFKTIGILAIYFYKLLISVILKRQKPSYDKLYDDKGKMDLFSKILGMVIFFLVFGFLIKWKLI